MITPGNTPASRQSAAKANIAPSEKRSTSCALGRRLAARPAEEGHAEGLDEAGRGQRRRKRQQRADRRHQNLRPHCGTSGLTRIAWKVSHSETKPLSGGSAEMAAAADQEGEGRKRHAVDQAAQLLHVALAGRRQHGAGAEEQQALEQRVIEHVEQRRRQRERRGQAHGVGLEGERQAEADEDDADVLDRVVGEQALQVVLHQRVQHAEHRGGAAEHQDHHAPPPGGRPEQVEHDAHEAVDRDLGHDPAHQRRDVARRRRVGERQPDVQRHEPGLRSGAEQHQRQHQGGECPRAGRRRGSPRRRSRRPARRAGRRRAAATSVPKLAITR